MNKNLRQGFTLIEILIVVAIIAILASVVLVGLGPTQQSGRDARRLSDLREVQTGLELYYSKCGYYPGTYEGASPCDAFSPSTGYTQMAGVLTSAANDLGITTMPVDPTAGKSYMYATGNGGTSYILAATLENKSNSAFVNYTPPEPGQFSDGEDTITSCAAPTYCITL